MSKRKIPNGKQHDDEDDVELGLLRRTYLMEYVETIIFQMK